MSWWLTWLASSETSEAGREAAAAAADEEEEEAEDEALGKPITSEARCFPLSLALLITTFVESLPISRVVMIAFGFVSKEVPGLGTVISVLNEVPAAPKSKVERGEEKEVECVDERDEDAEAEAEK